MKLHSRLRQQAIDGRQQQCTMSPTGLFPMLDQDAVFIKNRHTLPRRGRFNREDLHRGYKVCPKSSAVIV